jgi:gag-polypeptide of LTR copia-type
MDYSAKDLLRYPKLNEENYLDWSFNMQNALEAAGLWEYADPDTAPPGGQAAPAQSQSGTSTKVEGAASTTTPATSSTTSMQTQTLKVKALIVLACERSVQRHLRTCKTGWEAWSFLAQTYKSKDAASKMATHKWFLYMH